MAVVGGGHINAGFLAAGLLDEVSLLIGAGIDGRGGMAAVFYGLPMERPVPANVKHWHGAKKDSWFQPYCGRGSGRKMRK